MVTASLDGVVDKIYKLIYKKDKEDKLLEKLLKELGKSYKLDLNVEFSSILSPQISRAILDILDWWKSTYERASTFYVPIHYRLNLYSIGNKEIYIDIITLNDFNIPPFDKKNSVFEALIEISYILLYKRHIDYNDILDNLPEVLRNKIIEISRDKGIDISSILAPIIAYDILKKFGIEDKYNINHIISRFMVYAQYNILPSAKYIKTPKYKEEEKAIELIENFEEQNRRKYLGYINGLDIIKEYRL